MSTRTELEGREAVASQLRSLTGEILAEWERLARARVPAAKPQSHLALRDSLPLFLEHLAKTLQAPDPRTEREENARIAREHGEDRAEQPGYTLDDIVAEYRLLRATVFSQLLSRAPLDETSRSIIHDAIDRGVGTAVSRYVELEIKNHELQKLEIENMRFRAERASLAKTAFLANMSHEIRTPLGAIMGFSGLLGDKELGRADVDRYLGIINRNSLHLLRIIDDILDLTKVEAGKMTIENIEFSFLEFLADFCSLAAFRARENGITFEFIPETDLPERVISDPTRLRQILTNVVGNAIKFTERGKVELLISYTNKQLLFKVKDTGRGISDDQRIGLFQAFSQADSSTTRKFGGTGLGLLLTKNLTRALGGDFVLLESALDVGSTFAASVLADTPRQKVPAFRTLRERLHLAEADSPTDPQNLRGVRILVVEDSPDNQFLIQRMLSKTGAILTMASNGAEGLQASRLGRFDILLIDIQMPVMDGHEAVRILRAEGYSGPIVALTAHAMKEESERAFESGFSHFLTKPIEQKGLLTLLSALKRRHHDSEGRRPSSDRP